jgi:hypothetical protein
VLASFQNPHTYGFNNREIDQERNMRRNTFIATVGLVLLFGSAASSTGQVKRVQMHIAGYLCGN